MSDPGMTYLNNLTDSFLDIGINRERPTQPDEHPDDSALHEAARTTVHEDMRWHDAWLDMWDSDALDVTSLATAMLEMHLGHEDAAMVALRRAVGETLMALVDQEHDELLREGR